MTRLGLIVNPVAGIGGRVGLKGSDGAAIQLRALAMGARPLAQLRAAQALEILQPWRNKLELITAPDAMGEAAARQAGFIPQVLDLQTAATTSAEDTIRAAREMLERHVDLLLFAGGDGTARDICAAVGTQMTVLGIPAGVKIQSAVFAIHPGAAGELAAAFLQGNCRHRFEAEVLDLDEDAYRAGAIRPRLYGYLNVPSRPQLLQSKKAPTPAADAVRAAAIAADVIEHMRPGWQYIVGPGTTTRAIAERLGFSKTLIGVDVYNRQAVVALDVGEQRLLELLERGPAKIIITPIGGQGFIFGRGNQPISPSVLRRVGRENIILVSLPEKLIALQGRPLLADSGDAQVDRMFCGFRPVVTGYREQVMYKIS